MSALPKTKRELFQRDLDSGMTVRQVAAKHEITAQHVYHSLSNPTGIRAPKPPRFNVTAGVDSATKRELDVRAAAFDMSMSELVGAIVKLHIQTTALDPVAALTYRRLFPKRGRGGGSHDTPFTTPPPTVVPSPPCPEQKPRRGRSNAKSGSRTGRRS